MKPTTAIKQARKKVKMYRVGNQWQTSTWSESHRAWWVGQCEDYPRALRSKSNAIVSFALQAMGADFSNAVCFSYSFYDLGTIMDRVVKGAAILRL